MPTAQPILHDTTKFDGSLHYRFSATVAYQDENTLAIYRGPARLESYRGAFVVKGHLLVVFYKHVHHNVGIHWDDQWNPHMHYVNIATPATWDNERVTAADENLDILRFANKDEVFLDDEDEFEEHQTAMGYPEELVATCWKEVDRLRDAVEARTGIFSDSIFSWRPQSALTKESIQAITD